MTNKNLFTKVERFLFYLSSHKEVDNSTSLVYTTKGQNQILELK